MISKKYWAFYMSCIFLACLWCTSAWANKSSVEIDAPDKAVKGEEIAVKIHVSHEGNSFMHHTEWVYIKINGREVKKWEYSMFSKPDSENFTVEIRYTVNTRFEIEAKASCNLHGSRNTATKTVSVEPE